MEISRRRYFIFRLTGVDLAPDKAGSLASLIRRSGFSDRISQAVVLSSKISREFFRNFEKLCAEVSLNIRCSDSLESVLDRLGGLSGRQDFNPSPD